MAEAAGGETSTHVPTAQRPTTDGAKAAALDDVSTRKGDQPTPPDGIPGGSASRPAANGFQFLQPRWRTRRIVFLIVASVLLIFVAAAVRYYRLNAGLVRTDNAQTAGDVAPISARITGTVSRVAINENDFVKAGSVLVELDVTDYRLALAHAKAQLAAARAQAEAMRVAMAAQGEQFQAAVSNAQAAMQSAEPHLSQAQAQLRMSGQTSPAQIAQARAQVTTAQANVLAAKSDLDTAARNLGRDRALLSQGAISAQQLDTDSAIYETARARYQASQDALRQAGDALVAAQASQEQVTMARQDVEVKRGEISQARAQLQQAATGQTLVQQRARELAVAEAQAADAASAVEMGQVNLSRTRILAPEDGWVTNKIVVIGQVVQPNQPLLSLTLAHHFWVVANVKETQVGGIRAGQPVRITVDAMRRQVFHGHVESIGKTTGSTTALLPPDNATGNFIKVVQLVPVRIGFDPDSSGDPPLQIGLSCEVAIDTRPARR
jgi:membrane fusion protein (multidrug efflux system)